MSSSTLRSLLPRGALQAALLALSGALPAAQSVKLNDRLIGQPQGNVGSFALAAGGTRAVFEADLSGQGAPPELHSVPLDGSAAPLLLTGSLTGTVFEFSTGAAGEHVFVRTVAGDGHSRLFRVPVSGGQPLLLSGAEEVKGFELDPTLQGVVYVAELTPGVTELFSVPADGSSPRVKLNGTMPVGGDVWTFLPAVSLSPGVRISPDGTRVVYIADQDTNDVFDLYSAPIDGSAAAVRLNLSRPLADVQSFQISFESLGVVYLADQDTEGYNELYAVRIDGSLPPVQRSGPPNGPFGVGDFQVATGSDRVIWRVLTSGHVELFSVGAIAGGTPVRLNPPTIAGRVVGSQVSADGMRVVYLADQTTAGQYELYGVPADGSAPALQLSGPEHELGELAVFQIADGTGRVLFRSDTHPGGVLLDELYSVPLEGGEAAVRLHGDLPPGGFVRRIEGVLPDGTVLFAASLEVAGRPELYRAPVDGSTSPVRLNDDLPSGTFIDDVEFTPGGSRVAFLRQGFVASFGKTELFSTLALGGQTVRLSPELSAGPPFVDVGFEWRVTSDGSRVVYLAAEDPSVVPDLHSARTDGSGHSTQLNPPIPPDTSIQEFFQISPDGAWVVSHLESDFDTRLYSSRIDAHEAGVQLDGAPVPSPLRVVFSEVTPDSQQVVFVSTSGSSGALYVVPIDGSQPPQWLDDVNVPSGLAISPDGEWAVYRQGSFSGPTGLYSLPLDGHQGPALLGPQNDYHPFYITPDSSRVLHGRDNGLLQTEIYGVPIDGSAAPVRLNAPADGEVFPYGLSADGTRAVYTAHPESGPRQLYSVPVAGGVPRVRLNGPLAIGREVVLFSVAVDPSSGRVAYAADQETNDVFELFTVPVDGSSPPVKVSGDMEPGYDMLYRAPILFASGRVVYSTASGNQWRLHSSPIDGSLPPVDLTPALPLDSSHDVQLTVDGSGVVYSSEQRFPDVIEIYQVPIDGSAPARVVSGPMVAGGNVDSFLVSPDGEHVIYRADQEWDDALELFTGWLERPPRRAGAPSRSVFR